jgi:transcription-repair coupling factor (superfamily II helicase)
VRLADLPPLLREENAVAHLLGRNAATVAVPEAARAITIAGLARISQQRTFLVLLPTSTAADQLAADLRAYLDPDEVELFPAWETLPFERVSPAVETMGRRLRVMWRLRKPERAPRIVVAGVRALSQRLGPHVEDVEPVSVTAGQQVDPAEIVAELVRCGYRREYLVEHRGEVALRGSIVDVFPSTADAPVRIDLWGDEVDRLSEFSVHDQRSTADIAEADIFPARELLPTDEVRERAAALVAAEPWGREQWERLAEGLVFDGMESWMPWLTQGEHTLVDLLDANAQIVLVEPRRMRDRASEILAEEADLAGSLSKTWGASGAEFPRLHVPFDDLLAETPAGAWTFLPVADRPDAPSIEAMGWGPISGDGEGLARRLSGLLGERYRVVVAADTEGSARRLHELLLNVSLDLAVDLDGTSDLTRPGGRIVVAPLDHGFVLPSARLAVISESDLTGRRRAHRRPRPQRRDAVGFFEDLQPGDYVVHHTHGVGRYGGMVTRSMGGIERDYLLLEYKGGDRLYVPSDQIDAVRHYTGGDSPTLHRLGGSDFARTKARVKAAVREIAQELVVLYQRRVTSPGHAFPPDTPWQREMEEAFPYVETPDQLKAIADVKEDMEGEAPMDRLVCGDVGFGKTEVAIRAAFKAVQDGHQVAVLVPTTLLAQQHYATFGDRVAAYPVRVEVLSRFLTPGQAKGVVDGIRNGEVDIVIGTHRLLSEDISFKRLGLLVVDEEQRFGVGHKEAMKKLKTDVDVLTLTATPIPRTLEMSLTGIRDLTLLNTPPADRQPILTYVGEYDDRAVAEAIRRELLREGQVFFVHNRVQDIESVAASLRDLVPEARITVAHGQMDEGTLEQTVVDFWEGRFDVLVCTTIIESGIDMPTVNTLVVDRADMLGLGQLHQLRGRVGRAGQRAYAYLFHPVDRVLSEDAYERLRTIGEATELGSGFKIAMRDLEIRGAGNLLGENQSGHIAAVGYDLYCQMVTDAVGELKGEEVHEPAEVKLDLPIDAHLPPSYVGREELRLEAYRRLAAVTTEAEVDDIRAEWVDRYGLPPEPAEALLAVGRLRAECHRLGIREVTVGRGMARLLPLKLKTSEEVRFRRLARDGVYKPDSEEIQVRARSGDIAAALVAFLRELIPPEDAL